MYRTIATLTILTSALFTSPSHAVDAFFLTTECADFRSAITAWEAAAERMRRDLAMNISLDQSYESNTATINAPTEIAGSIITEFLEAETPILPEQLVSLKKLSEGIDSTAEAMRGAEWATQYLVENYHQRSKEVGLELHATVLIVLFETFEAWRNVRTAHFETTYAFMCP